MTYIYNKINVKRLMALVMAILISLTILLTIRPTLAGDGTVIDPILDASYDYIYSAVDKGATAFVEKICGGFAPSYDLYYKLSNPALYDLANILEAAIDGDVDGDYYLYRENFIINTVFSFSQKLGIVLSTIIAIICLLLCILGRAEQIRDTPVQIFVKYVVSLIFNYLSWNIIYYIMNVLNDIWTNFVMTSTTGTLSYSNFSQHLTVSTSDSEIKLFDVVIRGSSTAALTFVDKIIFGFLAIFLIWKLFKQFLRLYVEIAERYFVLTMLSLFSPTVIATIVSNSTSNIMHSYVRMFISQSFILLMNGIFMKIFVAVLILGGWTAGITNYICALAFMKFCMKIDSYMNSMGLNVAQTGGGMMDSIGGAFNSMMNAVRSFGMADRSIANYGKSLMAKGASTNNKTMYDRGMSLSGGISGRMTGSSPKVSAEASNSQFSNAVAKSATNDVTRKGAVYHTNGSSDSLNKLANTIHIPSPSLQNALNKNGISAESVHTVKQLNGSKQFSTEAGTRFALRDKDGNNLVVIDGLNTYSYKNRDKDIQAYMANESYENYMSSDDFKQSGIDVKDTENDIRHSSTETTFGVQNYIVPTADGHAEEWSATMVSMHPEVLDDRYATLTYNKNGDAISLKKIDNQAHNKKDDK